VKYREWGVSHTQWITTEWWSVSC